jgi:hypothetical protein
VHDELSRRLRRLEMSTGDYQIANDKDVTKLKTEGVTSNLAQWNHDEETAALRQGHHILEQQVSDQNVAMSIMHNQIVELMNRADHGAEGLTQHTRQISVLREQGGERQAHLEAVHEELKKLQHKLAKVTKHLSDNDDVFEASGSDFDEDYVEDDELTAMREIRAEVTRPAPINAFVPTVGADDSDDDDDETENESEAAGPGVQPINLDGTPFVPFLGPGHRLGGEPVEAVPPPSKKVRLTCQFFIRHENGILTLPYQCQHTIANVWYMVMEKLPTLDRQAHRLSTCGTPIREDTISLLPLA